MFESYGWQIGKGNVEEGSRKRATVLALALSGSAAANLGLGGVYCASYVRSDCGRPSYCDPESTGSREKADESNERRLLTLMSGMASLAIGGVCLGGSYIALGVARD